MAETGDSLAAQAHDTAEVDTGAVVGPATRIWQYAHVRSGALIGAGCVIGRGVYIGPGVIVGDHCKIQNYALVYEPAVLEPGVFVGPGVVFTNDEYPRAVNEDGSPKAAADWTPVGVTVRQGASVGARAVCVAPLTIGRWALVAAGSVVVADVPDFALVAGVPARRIGWVGTAGRPLSAQTPGVWTCPKTGATYHEVGPDALVEAS